MFIKTFAPKISLIPVLDNFGEVNARVGVFLVSNGTLWGKRGRVL